MKKLSFYPSSWRSHSHWDCLLAWMGLFLLSYYGSDSKQECPIMTLHLSSQKIIRYLSPVSQSQ